MDPIAFSIFGIAIHWYGLMMALGFLAAYLVAVNHAKRTGFPPEYVADSLIVSVIGGLVGARALYLITYWDDYVKFCQLNGRNPYARIVFVHEGGLVFLGGFIGAALAVFAMARIRKIGAAQIADFAAMGVPIGHAFGRIGCHMTGCCHGMPYDGFGAIHYPIAHYEAIAGKQIRQGLIQATDAACHPLFPSQLVASAGNFLIFVVIIVLARRRAFKKSGQLFGLYMMLYGVQRFSNEFLRGDYGDTHRHWSWLYSKGFTDAQALAPLIVLAGVTVFVLTRRFGPEAPTPVVHASKTPSTSDEAKDDA